MSSTSQPILSPTCQQFPNYPLAPHTTYRVGGMADLYVRPSSTTDVKKIICWAKQQHMPLFVLGGGANILIADNGIRGVVMDMTDLCGIRFGTEQVTFDAGIAIENAAAIMARNGMSGLHHFYGMPGTLGGAVWMNAQCYGSAISDLLEQVIWYDMDGNEHNMQVQKEDFSYKQSPFQKQQVVIATIAIRVRHGNRQDIEQEMFAHLSDRYQKGHYEKPSAGSVFKNDRRFGRPSGMIIDSLGLRGYQIGGAQVSPHHANIFINTGTASADDFRKLIESVHQKVYKAYNINLEQEVQYVGDWS